jgi:ferredoxin
MSAEELTIDRDRCMGSGQCIYHAPNTFDLDEIGVAIVIDQHGDDRADVDAAIAVCPTRSISRIGGDAQDTTTTGGGQ